MIRCLDLLIEKSKNTFAEFPEQYVITLDDMATSSKLPRFGNSPNKSSKHVTYSLFFSKLTRIFSKLPGHKSLLFLIVKKGLIFIEMYTVDVHHAINKTFNYYNLEDFFTSVWFCQKSGRLVRNSVKLVLNSIVFSKKHS